MKMEILDNSKNYTCQIIKLPPKLPIKGFDNLVEISIQGNSCLVNKDYDEKCLYLFFPVESVISHEFLSNNNLYRCCELNKDKTKRGFFEDNKRVKAIKFKGVISSGFVIPIHSLSYLNVNIDKLEVGSEFNLLQGNLICHKFVKKQSNLRTHEGNKKQKLIDEMIDKKLVPEHFNTDHFLKHIDKINWNDNIVITHKLHGTSARYFNTLVKRKLSVFEKIVKFLGVKVQEEEYAHICASRRIVKSVDSEKKNNKNYFDNSSDLWSIVGKEYFSGKLFKGEAVYCEIVGKTYTGENIQHGYTYGLNQPKVYVYRITNINPQGIEIDLPYEHMKKRSQQLGLEFCPEFYVGTFVDFVSKYIENSKRFIIDDTKKQEYIKDIFYNKLLEKPSILDDSVVEEGFCIRKDLYPKCEIFKIKSRQFLLHESAVNNDECVVNIEDEQSEAINAS